MWHELSQPTTRAHAHIKSLGREMGIGGQGGRGRGLHSPCLIQSLNASSIWIREQIGYYFFRAHRIRVLSAFSDTHKASANLWNRAMATINILDHWRLQRAPSSACAKLNWATLAAWIGPAKLRIQYSPETILRWNASECIEAINI